MEEKKSMKTQGRSRMENENESDSNKGVKIIYEEAESRVAKEKL